MSSDRNQEGHSYGYPLMSGWPYGTSAMPSPWQEHGSVAGTIIPRIDIVDTEESIIYIYDVAGADKNQINLEISRTEVALKIPTIEPLKHSGARYLYQERQKGYYARLLQAPVAVNMDDVKADYQNGILEVTFPKLKREQ